MKYTFTDRFSRQYFIDEDYDDPCLAYRYNKSQGRNDLPSTIWGDGFIVWVNVDSDWHCVTGPARLDIDGNIEYWLNDNQYDKMEWMLNVHELS